MTDKISFKTKGNVDIVDITSDVNKILQEQSVSEGIAFLFVPVQQVRLQLWNMNLV